MVKQGHGKVIWISSVADILKRPFLGTYCATKHAIEAIACVIKRVQGFNNVKKIKK